MFCRLSQIINIFAHSIKYFNWLQNQNEMENLGTWKTN